MALLTICGTPDMAGVDHRRYCTLKSSSRKVTLPNTTPALGGLTLELPWDIG